MSLPMAASANSAPASAPPLSVFRLSVPVAMGYIPLGIAFGFLMAQAGAAWWVAPLMSLLVYAGAAQFMAVPMFAAGESLAAIAVATLVVNLRKGKWRGLPHSTTAGGYWAAASATSSA